MGGWWWCSAEDLGLAASGTRRRRSRPWPSGRRAGRARRPGSPPLPGDALDVLRAARRPAPSSRSTACSCILSPRAIRYTNTPRYGRKITKITQSALATPPRSWLRKMSREHDDQQPDPDEEHEEPEHRPEDLPGPELCGDVHRCSLRLVEMFRPFARPLVTERVPRRCPRRGTRASSRCSSSLLREERRRRAPRRAGSRRSPRCTPSRSPSRNDVLAAAVICAGVLRVLLRRSPRRSRTTSSARLWTLS